MLKEGSDLKANHFGQRGGWTKIYFSPFGNYRKVNINCTFQLALILKIPRKKTDLDQ